MITITVAFITSILTTGAIYWYLHRSNPDLAQTVTDAVVKQAKDDAQAGVDAVKKSVD